MLRSAEAAEAAQREAKWSASHAVLVDNDTAATVAPTPVLRPHKTHVVI